MSVESRGQGAATVFVARKCGQRNRRKARHRPFQASDTPDQLIAVDVGQTDVAHEDIGFAGGQQVERFRRRRGYEDGGTMRFEEPLNHGAGIRVIVDDQYRHSLQRYFGVADLGVARLPQVIGQIQQRIRGPDRQIDRKGCALSFAVAPGLDRSAMKLDEVFGD